MHTFLLTWDGSDETYPPDEQAEHIAVTAEGRPVSGRWSIGGRTRDLSPNDRVFLLRQRTERGIIASGVLTDGVIHQDRHWLGGEHTANYVDVTWHVVLGTEDRLSVDVLRANIPDFSWDHVLQSGREVKSPHDALLDEVWQQHIREVGARRAGMRLSGMSALRWLSERYPGVVHVVDAYITTIIEAFGPDVRYEYVSYVDYDNPRNREIMIRIDAPIGNEAAWEKLVEAQTLLLERERIISRQSNLPAPLARVSMAIVGVDESWESVVAEIERES